MFKKVRPKSDVQNIAVTEADARIESNNKMPYLRPTHHTGRITNAPQPVSTMVCLASGQKQMIEDCQGFAVDVCGLSAIIQRSCRACTQGGCKLVPSGDASRGLLSARAGISTVLMIAVM